MRGGPGSCALGDRQESLHQASAGQHVLLAVWVVNLQIWLCTCSGSPGRLGALIAPHLPSCQESFLYLLDPPFSDWVAFCSYLCSTKTPEGQQGLCPEAGLGGPPVLASSQAGVG